MTEDNGAPIMVIYHGGCDDGVAAAMAVDTADTNLLGGPVEFIAGRYDIPIIPDTATGHHVVFVDFSYKRAVMAAICKVAKSVIVIDHHRSAMEDLRGLDAEYENLTLKFDMTKSGAVMAWEHFHPVDPLPLFYQYIQARDLWKLDSMPHVREFSNGLRSYKQDMKLWQRFLIGANVLDLVEGGVPITRYIEAKCEQLYDSVFPIRIAGHPTLVSNCPYFLASDMADYILQRNPDMAYSAAYFYRDRDRVQFSLRSRTGFDVQAIAVQFGGGGHPAAAGFTVMLPFGDLDPVRPVA